VAQFQRIDFNRHRPCDVTKFEVFMHFFLATVVQHHRDVMALVERHNGSDVAPRNLLRHRKSNLNNGQFD